jgi:uncharacterized membrane protein
MSTPRGAAHRRGVHGRARVLGLATLLFLVPSCGSGDLPLAVVDPAAAPAQPTYDQAKLILDRYCLPCHGGGGAPQARAHPARLAEDGEGEGASYGDCASIQSGLEGILSTSVRGNSMPPGALPRLSERDRLILERWIAQGACSPCTVGCP